MGSPVCHNVCTGLENWRSEWHVVVLVIFLPFELGILSDIEAD